MNFIFTPDFEDSEDDDFSAIDTFFDIEPKALPSDANTFYFNVLIKDIALRPGDLELPSITDMSDLWYIEHVMDARPWVAHFYIDEDNAKDTVIEYPHCVIEIRDSGEISWYHMIDYETEDRWKLWDDDDEDFYDFDSDDWEDDWE